MKGQYFFGYFFVRAARVIAILVTLIGIGFCVLQYSQAKAAASAVSYQSSAILQRALGNLRDAFSATERIVGAFNASNQVATPKLETPSFPAVIDSNADFAAVAATLSGVDQQRQQLKQSLVSRFEAPVRNIEAKLRAYASDLKSLQSPAPATSTAAPAVAPARATPLPDQQNEALFSSKLGVGDLEKRTANVALRKEFLKVLETKAESPENRLSISEAVEQLNVLSRLLPEKLDPAGAAQSESSNTPSREATSEQDRKVFPSERVAAQLEQVRGEIRDIFLSSWTLDETFEQASDLGAVERDKCRVATLAQKGIWLSAISRILIALLAAVLGSFVILVCADLVKTFLDTASHTGVVADAINAMRGSVVTTKRQSNSS